MQTSFCFDSYAFKSANRSSLAWVRSNMGHWFHARIWLNTKKKTWTWNVLAPKEEEQLLY